MYKRNKPVQLYSIYTSSTLRKTLSCSDTFYVITCTSPFVHSLKDFNNDLCLIFTFSLIRLVSEQTVINVFCRADVTGEGAC